MTIFLTWKYTKSTQCEFSGGPENILKNVLTWSCMYVIMYICDHIHTNSLLWTLRFSNSRFSVHSGRTTAASAHAQSAPQRLQRMLSQRLSSFLSCAVSASAASAHAQCVLSGFHAHSECDKVFGNMRGRLWRLLRMCQRCFIICSEAAAAALV